ncbi:YecA family protein [Alkalihalobacillus sp. 1P02AB]|uniref:YecA family protein n=1 Tax=Alkalihalobacillus sp. 1P02AB TaxID=3132260 RepID=UPI0039A4655C
MNILNTIKISKRESCPCGSGKLYKDCCKNIGIIQVQESKKPLEVQIMELMKKSMKKCCLYPEQNNCKGDIKNAHALQNNKIISLLGGSERHVYLLDPKKRPLLVPLKNGKKELFVEVSKTSVKAATTETCFCDLHDNIVFAAIEKGAPDFDGSNETMKFVYAYKAFIFEYYKQWMAINIFRTNFKKQPVVFKSFNMVKRYRMLQLKMKEFQSIKGHFDKKILSGKHDGIETCIVKLPEQIKFASYAYIAPDYDLDGRKIKHTAKGVMHRIAVTVFPEKTQSYILLSCLESEKAAYLDLFNQIQSSTIDKIKFYFSLVLPLYSENMVLSPDIWKNWDEETQIAYTFYANLQGSDASVYSKTIGMVLRNAGKSTTFDYSNRGKLDLFV